ncbi:glycosyltransferase [Psychroserpens sp. SPM9]|uniref:glycosyltransferase n=1 Tax=Psychroserpens sp. SPM9 TaxID=2975598 RepID=UPI0021A8A51B|nr:glycosyltransferase [Psychroserpens sp. SPM9]MDG5490133.1 glycosyltransferase [Psychroserpens sp. SPM9]
MPKDLSCSEKENYVVITPFFPSKANFRGPYVLDQVKAIENNSAYKVTVLKPKALFSKEQDYEFDGVNVHYFKRVVLPSNILPGLFKGLSRFFFFKKLKQLGLNPANIDVVHAHVTQNGMYANSLKAKNPKIKTTLQHHGFDVLSLENGILREQTWHKKWVKAFGVAICNKIDLHLGVSGKTLSCVSAFPEITINATYVLYNGVDTTKFYPIEGLKDNSVFKIGCIANFWPLKDQMTLILATHHLIKQGITNLKVDFIGSGDLLETCKAYVAQHQLESHITFQDEVTHQELNVFYNTLDLYVMPSYYEAFGCVYTEAYACGVPFMAVQDQGISELIPQNDQSKWLIAPKDSQGLAALINSYITNRTPQKLVTSIDINSLVTDYLDHLNRIAVV